ncbi:MAG: Fe-S cluster assembly protein IscX [Alphaproteobacteria bacterium]|nr:Fe-S cluster assembly protein IscX [Alphaproteobacteria bacterium]
MSLNWSDYFGIAEKLFELYPDEDLSVISYADLTKKVSELPDFDDKSTPSEAVLDAVLSCWTELMYGPETDETPSTQID